MAMLHLLIPMYIIGKVIVFKHVATDLKTIMEILIDDELTFK